MSKASKLLSKINELDGGSKDPLVQSGCAKIVAYCQKKSLSAAEIEQIKDQILDDEPLHNHTADTLAAIGLDMNIKSELVAIGLSSDEADAIMNVT
ncbi:hypothetical protein EVB32_277 [Rhizobium phage RHph_TM39]|nr:hypothetical protein EVB32_277 [Rhizobium phage RHph_TM39]QIG77869.1 hypothetical protein EVB64_295 [Rhizobium phage RHph_TM61]